MFSEVLRGDRLIHVAGTGIPPWTSSVGGANTGTDLGDAKANQVAGSGAWSLPLTPQDGA